MARQQPGLGQTVQSLIHQIVGTRLGVAIKSDTVDEPDTQEFNNQEKANDDQ